MDRSPPRANTASFLVGKTPHSLGTMRRTRRQGINMTRVHGLESLNERKGKTSFDNEDSLFWGRVDDNFYHKLEAKFSSWLQTKYRNSAGLRKACPLDGKPITPRGQL